MPVQIGQMLIITLESLLKVYASIKSIPNYSVEDYVRLEKKKTDFEEHHFVMFYMICNVIYHESENCFLLRFML